MRRTALLAAFVLTAALAGPAAAQQDHTEGSFVMDVFAHSEFGSPGGAPLLFDADALDYDFDEGESFSYSSITCEADAPHNDRALRINPDYPGVDNPDSVRHDVDGTVTEYDEDSGTGTIEGTITTVHCPTGDEIYFEYEAEFVEDGPNNLILRQGSWEITGGTGIFSDLDGEGRLSGRLTCLPLVLERHAADNCEELGAYSDAIMRLRGQWEDETVGDDTD